MKGNARHFTTQLRKGHVDVAKVFIQNGADVNAVGKHKLWTALHFTGWKGHADVAKVLIQNGTDVNAVTKKKTGQHFTSQLRMDMLTLREC